MVRTSQDAPPTDLTDFFSASEARTDRWRQLSAIGRVWDSAAANADDSLHAEAGRLFAELSPLESYWAYPGPRLSAAIAEAIEQRNTGVFARLVQKISATLLTGSYRYESAAWDPLQENDARTAEVLPPDLQSAELHKPYFEVLIVTPNDPSNWERARAEMKRLRRG